MFDILFDITTREVVIAGSGDTSSLQTTTNPSVQNGGIILRSRCAFRTNPMLGIGFDTQVMNAHPSVAVNELNRWKQMVMADNATTAKYSLLEDGAGNLQLDNIGISYV